PRHRHRRLHPAPAAPARRGLRRDPGGDAGRRRGRARRGRVGAGGEARRDARRGRARARRDRRWGAAGGARLEQGRRDRSAGPQARMIELPIRRLREDAVLPERAYAADAGLDLSACERHELAPGERAVVGTGLAVAIPEGYAGFVQPRSGLAARHGLSVVNAPGLIDAGYRGEIRVVLLNTDLRQPFVVEPGMRIAQLVVLPVPELELAEV